MNSLAILPLLLVVSPVSLFNLRGPANATLQRQLFIPGMETKGVVRLYPRIINGEKAALNQFPYDVGLQFNDGDLGYAWCGGALIANEWVLTAAHCTLNARSVRVEVGMTTQLYAAVVYTVDKYNILAADYNETSARADIALIQIPHVNYTSAIQPIALPRKASTYPDYVGTTAIASGWGFTSNNATAFSYSLQYAILKVISNSQCEKYYDKDSIYSGKICTGNTSGEICRGDSGGPLVSKVTGALIGIASFAASDGCGKGHPDAYTRVDFYLDWIQQITKLKL